MAKLYAPLLSVLFLVLIFQLSHAQTFKIIKDINQQKNGNPANASQNGYQYAVTNGKAYFAADDGIHGTELWSSDGTTAGTVLVKDVFPGITGSKINFIHAFKNKVYFFAQSNQYYFQFWQSDGTAGGTTLLIDSLSLRGYINAFLTSYIDFDDVLLFSVSRGFDNEELWKTDGTREGTQRLINVNTPAYGNQHGINEFTRYNSQVFFTTANQQLWVTDGTAANTKRFRFKNDNNSQFIRNLSVFNGKFHFTFNGALFQSSGDSASTIPIFNVGINDYAVLKGDIYYIDIILPITKGFNLYKYNPAAPYQSELVAKITADHLFNGRFLQTIGDSLLYFTGGDSGGHVKLWVTNGTGTGTFALHDKTYPYKNFIPFGGKFYFPGNDNNGEELWVTNGTLAGTKQVKDINPGIFSSFPANITPFNTKLLFTANNGAAGFELWQSDGTAAGTSLVKDINITSTSSANPSLYPGFYDTLNNRLIFSANDGVHGNELWATDGSPAGTHLVKDLFTGSKDGLNNNTTGWQLNNRFKDNDYFFGWDSSNNSALYKTNGTTANTRFATAVVKTIDGISPITIASTKNKLFTIINPTIYQHSASYVDSGLGSRLFAYDGTNEPVLLKQDFASPYAYGVDNGQMLGVGSNAYFLVTPTGAGASGLDLWTSDGTVAGTKLVKNLYPGGSQGSGTTNYMIEFKGQAYFFASINFGFYYGNLWKTDGTSSGTVMLTGTQVIAQKPVIVNDKMYFIAIDADHGDELWVTDGTPAGTHMVKDIYAGPTGSNVFNLVNLNGVLYFTAYDGTFSIWKTDGTETGTVRVTNNISGQLAAGNNKLYFIFIGDNTIWQSDGTGAGTETMGNYGIEDVTGLDGLTYYNGKLYFTGYNPATGRELYVSQNLLPVSLLSFTAHLKNTDGLLQWSTVNEQNNSYFNVQRSFNGNDFTTVGRVNAQGNIKENDYNYTDANVTALGVSKLYYRLQQYDADGKFTYSKTIPLTIPLSTLVQVGPNPAADVANIYASVSIPKAVITITDAGGRVLYSAKQNIQAGTTTAIPLHGYAKGIYVMAIQGDNITKQEFKLVVGK